MANSIFVLDSARWNKTKEEIQKNFCQYWAAVIRHDIKEKWRYVKTRKPAPPGKPFRIRNDEPKKMKGKYIPIKGYCVGYEDKVARSRSNWAIRMEYGGESDIPLWRIFGFKGDPDYNG